jgi:hypothetical protein
MSCWKDATCREARRPIRYGGALNGEGREIEGRWTVIRVWSGKFDWRLGLICGQDASF